MGTVLISYTNFCLVGIRHLFEKPTYQCSLVQVLVYLKVATIKESIPSFPGNCEQEISLLVVGKKFASKAFVGTHIAFMYTVGK